VTDYKCNLLSKTGAVQAIYDVACHDDETAVANASRLFRTHLFEVWQEKRRVYTNVGLRLLSRAA
jgi:hypothetical protein